MTVRNLDAMFEPGSIAVVGASEKPDSVGYTLVNNLLTGGYQGTIYPVNPRYDQVLGLPAVHSAAELAAPPDLALVAIPAAAVARAVEQLAAIGTRAVVVISAGFREIGAVGRELEQELARVRARHEGLRILGPNCLGFIVPRLHLNASFGGGALEPGRVAFVSQSGALCTAVLDWARSEGVGFSMFASLGNMLDIDFADTIDYLAADDHTESMVLYVESIGEAREFLSAARAFTRRKPIVVHKAGRYEESAQAAASHTGAMAGLDAAYEAAFSRAAIVRVHDSREMVDCAELLARCRLPAGPRLAILTNAGGPGVMATDALIDAHGKLATLSESIRGQLNELLPAYWSHRNPVDVLGDATPERFAAAAKLLIEDEDVDALLAILTPQAMTRPGETAAQLVRAVKSVPKPTLAVWMGGGGVSAGRAALNHQGIPALETPEDAVRAFSRMADYARGLKLLYETPRAAPLALPGTPQQRRAQVAQQLAERKGVVDEPTSKSILDVYGIPSTKPRAARDAAEAAGLATQVGFPVVMKILSPDISHKSDVGGVRTGLQTADEVRRAFDDMVARVRALVPQARVDGVTLQPQVAPIYSVELILGGRRDPTFGPLVMVGLGGTAAEILRDCAFELPPLDDRLARRMLERLRIWPLLGGYRGRPPLAVDRVVEVMLRLSTMLVECPEVGEVDLNPLLVSTSDVIALDARVAIADGPASVRPYDHLAIAPYPEHLIRRQELKDGTPVVLRPIRPEDEPLWHAMVDASSDETFLARFRSLFRSVVHNQAARYCFIDYDREMAFVAEVTTAGGSQLVGVGRLVADPTRESAEFGVLVIDSWQRRGLGGQLLDVCLEYAREAGYPRVYAETGWDNHSMLTLFRKRGFKIDHFPHDPTTLRATLAAGVP